MTAFLWKPNQQTATERLRAFLPSAGRSYASQRNYDNGPEDRSNVSALSPWVRHRVITEERIAFDVLGQHSFTAAEKFIQEVVWRTYWKGWLEQRPSVWGNYLADLAQLRSALSDDSELRDSYERAITGRTGIDGFDEWVAELVNHGWLHNHARMWFASIWVFTLELPWQLGAGFFYDHLLDADPASNTLSWRWVSGLQTIGKTYLARPDNIHKYTRGRFHPVGQLATDAPPMESKAHPSPTRLAPAERLAPPNSPGENDGLSGNVGLLVTVEDLSPEDHVDADQISATAVLAPSEPSTPSSRRREFQQGLLDDASLRIADVFAGEPARLASGNDAVAWARSAGVQTVLSPFASVGPTADQLAEIRHALADAGIGWITSQRRWDHAFYPHAKKGFFNMRSKIPGVLSGLGMSV